MNWRHVKTVLLVFVVATWAVVGCSEDKGALCDQEVMDSCKEHAYGQCVEEGGEARCVCDASAHYKTTGLTCAPILSSCNEVCSEDVDCKVGGADRGHLCNDKKCVLCSKDVECKAEAAGWTEACTKDGDECATGRVCIDVNGRGKCARDSSAGACGPGQEEYEMSPIGGSEAVEVCGTVRADYAKCMDDDDDEVDECVTTECLKDDECFVKFVGWTVDCTEDGGECEPTNKICIETVKGGRCAQGCINCPEECGEDEKVYEMPLLGGAEGNTVKVCGVETAVNATCDKGECVDPCDTDADCEGAYPTCDTDADLCVCSEDQHCVDNEPGTSVCNEDGKCVCGEDSDCLEDDDPSTSKCEEGVCVCGQDSDCDDVPGTSKCVGGKCLCAVDADCSDVDNTDICLEGVCVCAADSACTADRAFDDTTWTCAD